MPPARNRQRRHRLLVAILTLTAILLPAAPASAGTYTVAGTCGLWEPYNTANSGITVFPNCHELWARNVAAVDTSA